jgi:hypothetical protein
MYNSIIIKVALSFYSVGAGFVVWFLWKNTDAPNAFQNAGILFASIIPVLILVSPLLKAEKLEKVFLYTLFFDYKNKEITVGQGHNPYLSGYLSMFTNTSLSIGGDPNSRDECTDIFKPKGMDIIEKGVLQTLMGKFGAHWDIEPKELRGPVYTSITWSNNSKLKVETISLARLKTIFKHNQTISHPGTIVHSKLSMPPGSFRVDCDANPATRTFVFNNSYSCLKIQIVDAGGAILQQGIKGVILPDTDDTNRYWAESYKVSISMDLKKTKAYSPDMKFHRRWFANITDSLSVYDWQSIEKNL